MEPEQFNQLPFDTQVELMKNKPYFRRLNKSYYTQGEILFEQKYCDIDISINEIINYISGDDVEEFAIFYIHDEIITIDYYIIEENGDYEYVLLRREMYYKNVDMGEFQLISEDLDTGKDLGDIIELLSNENMYMDVKSVNHIVARRGIKKHRSFNSIDIDELEEPLFKETRGCKNAKEYTLNYMNNILKKNSGGVGDIGILFKHFIKVFYLTTSYEVITGYYKNKNYVANNITFNEMGMVFRDDKKRYQQELVNCDAAIKIYYDKIIQWLEK